MLTYIVLFCLVSVSVTKSPTRPDIPDTFVSWLVGTVSTGSDQELYYVSAYYGVDEKEKRIVENITVTPNDNTSDSTYLTIINLYDKDTTYNIQWDDGDFKSGKCSKSKLPQSSFPKIWDWVKNATYTGRYEFLNFDSWSFQDDKTTTLLSVSTTDSKRPIFIYFVNGTINETIFFSGFEDTTPPKGSFDLPSICSKDDTRMESFPVYTSIFNSFLSKKRVKNTITGNYERNIHPVVHKMLDKVMWHRK